MTTGSAMTIKSSRVQLGGLQAWVVCISAALFFFYEFIQMTMFNTLNSYLMQAFSIDSVGVSHLSSAYLWGDTLFLIPAGLLLDRYSTKRLILLNLFLCVMVTAVFASSSSYSIAFVCRLVAGVGNAFCFLACMQLAARWFPASRLALITGVIVTIAMLGGLAAQAPCLYLVDQIGWRGTMLANAGLGLFFLVVLAMTLKDSPQRTVSQATRTANPTLSLWQGFRMAAKNPQNWYAGLYTSLLNLPLMILGALWGVAYLQKAYELTAQQSSAAVGMIFLGTIVGSPLLGWLSDRFQQRRSPMLICAVLSLLLMAYLVLAPSLSFANVTLLLFLLGFVTSAQVIGYPVITESNSQVLTGTAMGLASTLIMGGAALGQDLFGVLLRAFWDGTIENGQPLYTQAQFHQAIWMLPIAFVGALLMAYLIRETHCRAGHE